MGVELLSLSVNIAITVAPSHSHCKSWFYHFLVNKNVENPAFSYPMILNFGFVFCILLSCHSIFLTSLSLYTFVVWASLIRYSFTSIEVQQ